MLLNISDKEYRKLDCLSQSDLNKILQDVRKWALVPFKQTKEMLKGIYTHLIVFGQIEELKEFPILTNKIITVINDEYEAKTGKKATSIKMTNLFKERINKIFPDDLYLDEKDIEECNNLALKIFDTNYFQSGLKEQAIKFWFAGHKLKAKIDYYNDKVMRDLKTINDISKVNKAMQGYLLQAGLYEYGLNQIDGLERKVEYIFIEKAFPHTICKVEVPREALDYGLYLAKKALDIYDNYTANRFTYDYTYKLPNFLKYEMEQDF